jgi:polyribonucleotide nucleotidyltransferase
VLNEIQSEHPRVYFDINRDSTTMKLRGKPENLGPAKAKLLCLDVSSRTMDITSRETSLIVGKGGATINRLMNDYGVSINVSSAESTSSSVEVVGLTSSLDATFVEIESILFENEELEESILVQPLVRNKLLANNGAVMKELQAEIKTIIEPNGGSALILFEKISRDEGKSSSAMIVKANRPNLPIAKEAIQKKIAEVEANILTIHIDPDIIPAVLGKGGSVIASLRELGAGTEIFVDKSSGEVKIESSDEKSREAVTEAIDKIVAENQVMKIEIVKTLIGQILGDAGKELRKKITEDIGAAFNINSTDTHVVFRGTEEQVRSLVASIFCVLFLPFQLYLTPALINYNR